MPPKPVPLNIEPFHDYGILRSHVASGLAGRDVFVEPHVFVYDVHQQIFADIKVRQADLASADESTKNAVYAAVGEIVMRRKTAELVGHEVSGLAAFDLYQECQVHIKQHLPFFVKRLDSHVLRGLTLRRSDDGNGSH
jgi:hypothetical protein